MMGGFIPKRPVERLPLRAPNTRRDAGGRDDPRLVCGARRCLRVRLQNPVQRINETMRITRKVP